MRESRTKAILSPEAGGIMSGRPFLLACAVLLGLNFDLGARTGQKSAVIRANDGGYDGPFQSIFVPPKAASAVQPEPRQRSGHGHWTTAGPSR